MAQEEQERQMVACGPCRWGDEAGRRAGRMYREGHLYDLFLKGTSPNL